VCSANTSVPLRILKSDPNLNASEDDADHGDDDTHDLQRPHPEEAAVVRKVFRLAAQGKGVVRIAATLNAERAPAPRAQQRRPSGWVASSVRAVLYRELYVGTVVWGDVPSAVEIRRRLVDDYAT
jgi:hypothetical protein